MDERTGFVTQLGMAHETTFEVAEEFGFDYVELLLDDDGERRALDPEAIRDGADERDLDLLVHLPFALPDDWDGTLSLEVFTLDYGYIGVSKEYLDDVLAAVRPGR